jgi:hypothetical protein
MLCGLNQVGLTAVSAERRVAISHKSLLRNSRMAPVELPSTQRCAELTQPEAMSA